MSEVSHTKSVANNIIWGTIDNFLQKVVAVVLFLLLARALPPEVIGATGIVAAAFFIARVLLYAGFNFALIQRKEINQTDKNSVFFLVTVIAIVIYTAFFLLAQPLGVIFKNQYLPQILRVLPAVLLLGGFDVISEIVVARNLWFKELFIANTAASLLQCVVMISLLFNGYGIWSWVFALMSRHLIFTLTLCFYVRFFPTWHISFKRLQLFWKFGSKVFFSVFIDTVFNNLHKLVIGGVFDSSTLAYFNQGAMLPETVQSTANIAMSMVTYPVLSSHQDDAKKRKEMLESMIKISSYIVFSVMAGLIVTAKPLVLLLLTDKWLPSVPYVEIMALSLALYPFMSVFTIGVNSMGKSDIGLKIEIAKKLIIVIALVISINFGIYAVLWGGFISSLIIALITIPLNQYIFGISVRAQSKWLLSNALLATAVGLGAAAVTTLNLNPLPSVLLQVFVGIAIFITASIIFRLECFRLLLHSLRKNKEVVSDT